MAFAFRAIISGLCAYVPNKELGVLDNPPTKMMVVMVDARRPRKAPDGKSLLAPHFPMIFLRGHQVGGAKGLPPNSDIAWRIDRKQVEIVIPQASLGTNKFSVFQAPRDQEFPFLSDLRDFSWGAEMKEIAPDLAEIDPAVFEDEASKGLVSARILLDKGKLSTFEIGDFNWTFPGTGFRDRQLSNRTVLAFDDLEEVAIAATDLDTGRRKEVSLRPRTRELVEINIGNFCDGCMPRQLHRREELIADDDFRWFYELSKNRESVKGGELPIPTPGKPGKGNGAAKCMRTTFLPKNFDEI